MVVRTSPNLVELDLTNCLVVTTNEECIRIQHQQKGHAAFAFTGGTVIKPPMRFRNVWDRVKLHWWVWKAIGQLQRDGIVTR